MEIFTDLRYMYIDVPSLPPSLPPSPDVPGVEEDGSDLLPTLKASQQSGGGEGHEG